MSDPIDVYFQNAQLSMAAYANLTVSMNNEPNVFKQQLRDHGFTDALANQFVANYRIAGDTFVDSATGLSVTLFQRTDTGMKTLAIRGTQRDDINDLIADGRLGVGEAATLNPQYKALQLCYLQLMLEGKVGANEIIEVTGHSLGGFLVQAFSVDYPTNVAHTYTFNAPGTGGIPIEVLQRLGVTESTIPSGLITNIISKNGWSLAAGLGTQVGTAINIFIEGTGFNFSFHDHQIATAVDALAFYDLIASIDPHVDVATVSSILEAVSTRPEDSLEMGLDALRVLFLGDRTPTPPGPSGLGDFNRDAYYTNVANLKNSLSASGALSGELTVRSLAGISSSDIYGPARTPTLDGLAYRYALRELNPFVIAGVDYFAQHNQDQSLSLYDPTTGTGAWTLVALSDRAELLAERLRFNAIDGLGSVSLNNSRPTHFVDMTTNFEVGNTFPHTNDVIFGTAEDDLALDGRTNDDHLYGGLGDDVIHGLGGRDYLEGNAGDDEIYGEDASDILLGQQGKDRLDGGSGADRMSGGADDDIYIVDNGGDVVTESTGGGNDEVFASVNYDLTSHVENLTLIGTANTSGTGNDLDNRIIGNVGNNRLAGKGGTDLLEGGIGFDTYVYNTGDGADRIEDSDAQGQIIFDGRLMQGGVRRAGDGANTYTSLDGRTTYVMSGTDLIVNGVLIVNENFESGQMGIQLRDVSGLPHDTGVPVGPFPDTYIGDSNDNDYVARSATGALAIYGNDGNDTLYGNHAPPVGAFQDLLDGGPGNDVFFGGYGDDYLIGGSGDDYAFMTDGDTFLGGDGADYAVGVADFWDSTSPRIGGGAHYADGGTGNDTLLGEVGGDVLLGGDGDDVLRGENRPEGWASLFYDVDFTWKPSLQPAFVTLLGGADYLDGGAGNDLLVGDGGDDILIGGVGDDVLYGESDFALTIPGTDWLEGGEGNDRLFGGAGADVLSGGDGDDLLVADFADVPGSADILDGGAGADELLGGGGDDILYGGTGIDRLGGFEGEDFLDGGADNDELQGGVGGDSLWGGTGDDSLYGQEGDDSLFGDEGDDLLVGAEGSDALFGGQGGDGLFGQDGDDLLSGDAGDDLLNGGQGHDQLDGGSGIDDVQGREGDDLVVGGAGDDFLYGDGNDPTVLNVIGGDDTLDGEEGDDQLWGGAGQDQLFGGDGADQLIGDAGNDVLFGEAGNDSLFGDSSLFANEAGTDLLDGGDGHDVLQGGGGDDRLEGGSGDDVLVGEFWDVPGATASDDDLHGGAGNDHLIGGAGSDTYRFNLGDGIDSVEDVGGENNRLVFGAGITADFLSLDVTAGDSLVVRVGNNGDAVQIVGYGVGSAPEFYSINRFEFADGTALTDSQLLARGFHLSAPVDGGTLHGTAFADHMQGSQADDWLYGRDGNDVLTGSQGDDVLEGEEGDDELDGGAGNDRLYGSSGSNVLRGGEGNDLLESAGVGDQLFGGAGDDSYQLWSVLQTIVEDVNAGTDTIHLSPTASLIFQTPDHVENVQIQDDFSLDPTMQVDLVGNTLDNQLSGSHRLDGREGNDTLVGSGDNTFVFGRGYGQDTVRTGTQWYAHTGLDQVEFLSDIAPDDLVIENHANDLVVRINGTTDQLTVESYFVLPSNRVDQFVFADGTVWGLNDIEGRVLTFVGSEADDTFYGTLRDDTIRGLGGNDQIRASLGNDLLDGGEGNDYLEGYIGNDIYVFGRGYGQDSIDEQGDSSDVDTLRLADGITPGDITLRATPDFSSEVFLSINDTNDQLSLGGFFAFESLRVDLIQFADGSIWDYSTMLARVEGVNLDGTEEVDYLSGNVTNDILSGLGGDDSLYGGAANDALLGGAGADWLDGGTGNDTLDGGTGADTMIGGAGNDLYVVDGIGDTVMEQAGQGTDTVQNSLTYTLGANVENLTLTGSAAINGTGNALNNTLIGNWAANVLTGGSGNDTYIVGEGDSVIEASSGGTDTVQTDITWILGANIERLVLTGTAAINGTGNSLANTLIGNSAANTLNGGTGVDTLIGGQGDDRYIVDNTSDKITEGVNEGLDTVQSSVSYTLAANVENLALTGTLVINGTGNGLDNVLVGNSAANRLTGGAGSDTYVIGAGDSIVEAVNAGIDSVQSSVTHTIAANVENLTLTGTAAINGTGNGLNNILVGNSAANTLTGGTGNDTYVVGMGDTVVEAFNAGTDTVQSSVTWTLGANVENLSLIGSEAINGTGNTLANALIGNGGNNALAGGDGNDTLTGGQGNDVLNGGIGNDVFQFARWDGQDTVTDTSGTSDRLNFGSGIDPLDLMLSRSADDLRIVLYGSTDQVTIANWYGGATNQIEAVQAGNGQQLMNAQVNQLIQAMAGFTQQTGLSWEQAVAQRPQDVQQILAASWQ